MPATDIGQVAALRAQRGGFIKVDRYVQLLPDAPAHALGDACAILQRHATYRDQGDHFSRSDARMYPGMMAQIQTFYSLPDRLKGSFPYDLNRRRERDHGPVMVMIRSAVQNRSPGGSDRIHNTVDLGGIAAFREIGNAFNESHL
jgi:hypothetical protein